MYRFAQQYTQLYLIQKFYIITWPNIDTILTPYYHTHIILIYRMKRVIPIAILYIYIYRLTPIKLGSLNMLWSIFFVGQFLPRFNSIHLYPLVFVAHIEQSLRCVYVCTYTETLKPKFTI